MHLLDEFLFLLGLKVVVPLGQAGLARPVLDQDELDGHLRDQKSVNKMFEHKTHTGEEEGTRHTPKRESLLLRDLLCAVKATTKGPTKQPSFCPNQTN